MTITFKNSGYGGTSSGGGGGGTTTVIRPSEYTDVSNATVQLTKDDQFVRMQSDTAEANSNLPLVSTVSDGHFVEFFRDAGSNPQIIESNDAIISAAPTVSDIPVTNIALNGSAIDASPLGQATTITGSTFFKSGTINGQTHDVMCIPEGATGSNSVSVPSTPVLGGEARTIFFQYRSEVDAAASDGHRIFGAGDKGPEGGFLGLTTIYTDSLRIDINGRAFTYNNRGRALRNTYWHSVAIVITNSTDDPKFYIDNFDAPLNISTIAGKNIPFDTKEGPITIGSWDIPNSKSLPGLYSNFQIYDRALSGDDLSNLAIQGLLGATDLTALDIHERIRFVYNSSMNLWQASDATLLRILDYSERITALENPADAARYRAVSLVTQVVNTSGSTVLDFEVEKENVNMSMSNGEQTFNDGGVYTVLINLNADDTTNLEAWVEFYNPVSAAWEPIPDTGIFDKGRYAESVTIASGSKLRVVANSASGNVTLAPVTLTNGIVVPSATISVAKV